MYAIKLVRFDSPEERLRQRVRSSGDREIGKPGDLEPESIETFIFLH
ncbi:hypothetical protein [Chamaesiphon sp. VAR_48_metabat_403]|nr:hypothetical protein [Chamaesiphon sp. VAR_48_metabat_403]